MLWGAAVLLGVLNTGPVAAQTRRSVWDGVFTAGQAARGRAIFAATCAECHGADLSGVNRPPLKGEVFLNHWMEGSLDALFTRVKSMPPNRANLGDIAYVDLLAFLLDANAFPAGPQELAVEGIPNIQVQGKNGPGPVPNFALVDVVGCFARGPHDTWMLTHGSEPARTRSPMQPTESEIAAARAKPLGSQTFQLLDAAYFSSKFLPEAHAGHRVIAKGFLIRTGTDVRINVTWVEVLAADCGR
jgi:cytochrome c553